MANEQPSRVEGLRHAHATLLSDLKKLEVAARAASDAAPEELAAQLRRTRAHLAEHFRFEEENGYMSAVLLRDPNQERHVQQSRDEHRRLFAALESLLDGAGQGAGEGLRAKVLEWVTAVRRHEGREDTFVLDVFNVDTGAED